MGLSALSVVDRRLWGKVVANSFTVSASKAERSRDRYGPAGVALLVAGTLWGAVGACVGWLWLPLFLLMDGTWDLASSCLFALTYVLMATAMLRLWQCRRQGTAWRAIQARRRTS